MTEKHKILIKDLDLLVQMLSKIKNRIEEECDSIEDDSIVRNFSLIISNYNLIKNELSNKIFESSEDSIENTVLQIINQLKTELEEMETKEKNLLTDLKRIDQLLMSEELTNDEINRLLDKRSQITVKSISSNY